VDLQLITWTSDSGGQRNLIVEFAAALPDGNPLNTNAVPWGFPFLIDDVTHEVVEPALLFLVDAYPIYPEPEEAEHPTRSLPLF
jgi:hypothetical protein